MTLIQENNETVITLKNNKIQKRYKEGKVPPKFLSPTWLKAYRGLCEYSDIVPKITKVSEDTIWMDYVEGIVLNQWLEKNQNNLKAITYMTSKVLELLQTQFDYCGLAEVPIIQMDLNGKNVIVREDESLCSIDPDTFELYPWDFEGSFAILDVINKCFRRGIRRVSF